jgi:hypothetical protein
MQDILVAQSPVLEIRMGLIAKQAQRLMPIIPETLYPVSKVDEGDHSMGYARKSFALFLNCEPAHCQHEPSIVLPWTPVRRKETLNQRHQVLIYEP